MSTGSRYSHRPNGCLLIEQADGACGDSLVGDLHSYSTIRERVDCTPQTVATWKAVSG